MKRIVSAVLVCILLVGSMLVLGSCGGPSGVYKDSTGITTMEFKGDKVTIKWSLGGFSYESEASFKITEEDGEKFITFTYGEGEKENSSFNGKMAYSDGTKDDKSFIQLGEGIFSTTLYKE